MKKLTAIRLGEHTNGERFPAFLLLCEVSPLPPTEQWAARLDVIQKQMHFEMHQCAMKEWKK